ncbi:VanZ family protein [Brevundimonas lenta]|uniref:VanZ family protein n=1 Tax=Brevundimonas lenta TaxID=424796 RepID=A0A7W6JFG4_9CAUL|nr:VanZ family protein [Brevundimonas lenta]MBB4084142.1 VanZ family protein [Brevundimonas lenta]
MPNSSWAKTFRAGTMICAIIVAWLAFRPTPDVDMGGQWDKLNHAAAFLTLTILAGCGWPRTSALRMAAIMLAAGVAIELIQGLPTIGRDADVFDVVADMTGFALGWLALTGGRLRRRLGLRE